MLENAMLYPMSRELRQAILEESATCELCDCEISDNERFCVNCKRWIEEGTESDD